MTREQAAKLTQNQINGLAVYQNALHLTAQEHSELADRIEALKMAVTQILVTSQSEIEKQKAQVLEKERQIAEIKKGKKP